jgi:hypothetical protein
VTDAKKANTPAPTQSGLGDTTAMVKAMRVGLGDSTLASMRGLFTQSVLGGISQGFGASDPEFTRRLLETLAPTTSAARADLEEASPPDWIGNDVLRATSSWATSHSSRSCSSTSGPSNTQKAPECSRT